ncbi:glycosyltransferase family 4 protein [Candidatus Woesearchaeota archaeon]|nr:glycosyltransferase family 4 protein [Candidatus Woesearchaeota archaeon]
MKIAILTPTFSHYSGIDRVVQQQAEEYAKKGHKVAVFALEGGIKPKNFRLELLGMPKSLFLQRLYRLFFFLDFIKIKKAAKKLKNYDIAISHQYPMNLIASRAKKYYKTKYIYHNHGIGYDYLFGSIFEKLYMKLFGCFTRLSLRNADSAFSVSKFLRNELMGETGIKSKVLYNKINPRYKKKLDGSKIRKRLGIKNNEKLLFFIGRLSPHKNVHTLLKIFELVNEEMPSAKLLIIGKPTFRGYFRKLKAMAGRNVIFKESIEDSNLPYCYAACDLYVTASLWEGFNLPIAEAQACGKKVVAFSIGSHPEVVKNGVLVKEGDIKGFANAAIKILESKQ